jgi:hypothetical protein
MRGGTLCLQCARFAFGDCRYDWDILGVRHAENIAERSLSLGCFQEITVKTWFRCSQYELGALPLSDLFRGDLIPDCFKSI